MNTNEYIEKGDEAFLHVYNRYPIVLDHGEGVYLYDTDGRQYLDFGAGIAVFSLGYGNKEYNDALKGQIDRLLHTSNLFYSAPSIEAAEKLLKVTGLNRVFFTNSGTEAIEGAIKLARRYAYNRDGFAGHEIIAMNHSFHGRSMGALSVTGTAHYREPFEPLIGGVRFADFNNLDSVKAALTDKTCAVILEPIQGEGGIYPAEPEFIKGVRALCDEKDLVMICDEIQCGMGRTGKMFAYEHYGIKPDVVTLAKALGCGVPVGAFVAGEKVMDAMKPGDHGTTYGGNPFVCAAVNEVLRQFEERSIAEHVREVSAYLEGKLDDLANTCSVFAVRRGMGLMQGLVCNVPVGNIVKACQKQGLIVLSAGSNVLRLVPPLVIEKKHVDEMIQKLSGAAAEIV